MNDQESSNISDKISQTPKQQESETPQTTSQQDTVPGKSGDAPMVEPVTQSLPTDEPVIEEETKEKESVTESSTSVIKNDAGVETFIVRDRHELSKMMDNANLLSGRKTTEQLQQEKSGKQAEIDPEDPNQNKFSIPADQFKDISEITIDNEEEFDYMISAILVQFIEKFNDKALEFPTCIDSNGRARIHSICNFLGMASHSQGQNKTRRIFAYPRHLFKEKQERELRAQLKEREKIKTKLEAANFPPILQDNPISIRDRLLKEVWHEIKGLPVFKAEEYYDGPTQVRVDELKVKMKAFEDKIRKEKEAFEGKKAQKVEKTEEVKGEAKEGSNPDETSAKRAHPFEEVSGTKGKDGSKKAKVIRYKGKEAMEECKDGNAALDGEQPEEHDSDLDIDSDEMPDEYFEMTDEQKKAYRQQKDRIRKAKQEDFQRRDNYHKQLKETTLKTFKDRPDEIKTIKVVHVEGHMLVIGWDAPQDNNSPILRYNVYLSSKKIKVNEIQIDSQAQQSKASDKVGHELQKVATIDVKDERFYEFHQLEKGTCYYVVVTAENQHGEGYKAIPTMVRTLSQDVETEALTLYVWGNNSNSEIALSDDIVVQNVSYYLKSCMKKVVRNTLFERESVLQVACGNTQSIFLVIDKESKSQIVVQSGLTTITKDEKNTRTVFGQQETEKHLETIPSLPFAVNFQHQVAKVICGDQFASVLTAQGDVYTWGWNIYGQLGIKDSTLGVTLTPMRVDFENKEKIIDIACGFNHSIALTENKSVYVWGKRMGLYPQFEFNRAGIEQVEHILLREINQDTPRLLKQNLIYYKIAKVKAGQSNSGLITETGEFLIHGMNERGQLGVGEEVSHSLSFFGDFMKKDFFHLNSLRVLDVSFGSFHTLVLCKDLKTQKNRVFGCGQSEFGQLCQVSELTFYDFIELTDKMPGTIESISAGSFHSLFMTSEKKLFMCGQNSEGQLGFKSTSKTQGKPIEVKFTPSPQEKFSVEFVTAFGGSLYTMGLCKTSDKK